MKKTKLIVFDIDGTLTDSKMLHYAAYTGAFADLGFSSFNDDFGGYKHYTDSGIFVEAYLNEFAKEPAQAAIDKFADSHLAHFKEVLKISRINEIKGARAFIKLLNDSQWAHCFATGSFVRPARIKLEEAGIDYNAEVLASASEHISRKEIVLSAIAKAKRFYGQNFEQIIAFGDGIWDLLTARELGLELIAIGSDADSYELIERGAKLFKDFSQKEEILEYINNL